MKFIKKPIEIEAVQWLGYNEQDIYGFARQSDGLIEVEGTTLLIHTLEGLMRADKGDWIIRGVKGEYYPCKPDIFAETYEPVALEALKENKELKVAENKED